jgi:ribosomal protein S18 acetylase RimI-like enzyme
MLAPACENKFNPDRRRKIRMDIVIKKMESDDEIKGKAFVHWRSWQEAYSGLVDQQYLDSLTLEKCEQSAYRWPDNIIIAKDGDHVAGFAAYGKCRDDELENAGEVFAIYILPEYYGKGVGYRLMKAVLSHLEEYTTIALWVLKDNQRAIHFYERFGYRFDGSENTLVLGSPVTVVRMLLER